MTRARVRTRRRGHVIHRRSTLLLHRAEDARHRRSISRERTLAQNVLANQVCDRRGVLSIVGVQGVLAVATTCALTAVGVRARAVRVAVHKLLGHFTRHRNVGHTTNVDCVLETVRKAAAVAAAVAAVAVAAARPSAVAAVVARQLVEHQWRNRNVRHTVDRQRHTRLRTQGKAWHGTVTATAAVTVALTGSLLEHLRNVVHRRGALLHHSVEQVAVTTAAVSAVAALRRVSARAAAKRIKAARGRVRVAVGVQGLVWNSTRRIRGLSTCTTAGVQLAERAVRVLDEELGRVQLGVAVRELDVVHVVVAHMRGSSSSVHIVVRVSTIHVRSKLRDVMLTVLRDRHKRNVHVLPLLRARQVWAPLHGHLLTRASRGRSKGLETSHAGVGNRSSVHQHASGSHESGEYKVLHFGTCSKECVCEERLW